ncbi:hypothetical protein GC425_02555 [Corynebacterium sp. zg254]|uniref:Uncharacterized protein n=1 Tax=Corynebacterium zhongnanshanii TaxID=2768834 RepID=A0ABQ6VFE7_9CORY|nr:MULTISPECIES: hypothetical protein [Corynebacterium]KAB3523142.1 hypothetical protein F8377_03070 [Corynebacterium zhongnanshanii]MCR5913752.1 hypothetical protein [Corynebacterium sp. zg254]
MHHLPDIECIFSATQCAPDTVNSILNDIDTHQAETLTAALRLLEDYILAHTETDAENGADKDLMTCYEVTIGELIKRYIPARWKKLEQTTAGLDGHGILLPDDSVIVPKIMLEDLLHTRQTGTLEFYLVGVNGE